jgi:hypothetical protein
MPESKISYTEAVIPYENYERNPEKAVTAIVNGVKDVLEGGEFTLDPSLGVVEHKGGDRFRFIGERGARRLDEAQEATIRLDNLAVARDMESSGKDARIVKIATSWERGADGKWRYETPDFKIKQDAIPEDRTTELLEKLKELRKQSSEYEKRIDRLFDKRDWYPRRNRTAEQKAQVKEIDKQIKSLYKQRDAVEQEYGEIRVMLETNEKGKVKLGDLIVDENGLFDAYPELKDLTVSFDDLEVGTKGLTKTDSWSGEVLGIDISKRMDVRQIESVLNHEVQHAIQNYEGFARGGVIDEFEDKRAKVIRDLNFYTSGDLLKGGTVISDSKSLEDALNKSMNIRVDGYENYRIRDGYADILQRIANKYGYNNIDALVADFGNIPSAFEQYHRLAGEVESRNVQSRMSMTEEERRSRLASETEDVAREDQIFLYMGANPFSRSEDNGSRLRVDYKRGKAESVEEVNQRFNEQLDAFAKGEQHDDLLLGQPGRILRACGLNTEEMFITPKALHAHMKKHNLSVEDIKNLPDAIQEPLMVYTWGGKAKSLIVITDMQRGNQRITAAVKLVRNGKAVEVNEIASVHGKDIERVLSEMSTDKSDFGKDNLKYVDKEKAADWLGLVPPKGTASLTDPQLHAAKIIEEFENPTVDDAKDSEGSETRFRTDPQRTFDRTVADLHEASAKQGLSQTLGKEFDGFLDNVMQSTSEATRRGIVDTARGRGWDFRKGASEYLAKLADADFDAATLADVKSLFLETMKRAGYDVPEGATIPNNEMRYLLWKNYQHERGESGPLALASDIAKQAELKVGRFAEPVNDTLFRLDPVRRSRAIARQAYERRVSSGVYQTVEALQDSMLGLKTAMQAIAEASGDKRNIEEYADFENAYLGENRLSSINQSEMTQYAQTFFHPLLEEIAKLAPNDEARTQLTEYMMAKHGLERNAYMRAQEIAEGGKGNRDYSGLVALTGEPDVATAEAEAQNIVDAYEAAHNTANLWAKVNAATGETLHKVFDSGLITKEVYDQIRGMYQYYIPLRGFNEKTGEDEWAYIGNRNSSFNAPIRTAHGRTSLADDPIAYIESMAESAILQGNRNKIVKQKFLNFVLNRPSDLVSVSKLWLEYDAPSDSWHPVFPTDIDEKDTPEVVEQKVKDFNERMETLAQAEPDRYKSGKDAKGIPYRVVHQSNENQHHVIVKRFGEDIVLTINGNPRAAQALNGLTNPNNDAGTFNPFLRLGEWCNRNLSAAYTTRNPGFILSNFIRDIVYSNSMVWVKESPAYALRFHKNCALANPKKMMSLIRAWENGTLTGGDKLSDYFIEFMKNGGETGYTSLRDIDQHKNDIAKELKRMNGKIPVQVAAGALVDYLDSANRAIENCARFAAFVTSREMGRDMGRSIWDAKEISVNFNKKGAGNKFMSAKGQTLMGNTASAVSGLGRVGYVFWNAAIQGTTNFGKIAVRHRKKAYKAIASTFLLGMMMPVLAAAFGGGGDDDDKTVDGEKKKYGYFDLASNVRRTNIMIPLWGNEYLSIPLPVEFRSIYGMGELLSSALFGPYQMTGGELASEMAAQLSQLLPLDFAGDGGWRAIFPTVFKPLAEMGANQSWTGLPIYKDNEWNKVMPAYTKAYPKTNKMLVKACETLNNITGGDAYKPGFINLNPALIEYGLTSFLGGYADVANKMTQMGTWALSDNRAENFNPSNFLFLNRVMKQADERAATHEVNKAFFRLVDEARLTSQRVNGYEYDIEMDIHDYNDKLEKLYDSPAYDRMEVVHEYQQEIKDIYEEHKYEADPEVQAMLEAEVLDLKREMIEVCNSIGKR